VYRYHEGAPDYLLLRGANLESFWTPIHGPIGFGEKLESAIRREVMDDIGLARPSRLIDLEMPTRWQLGDEETIEWVFGFHAQPRGDSLQVDTERWAAFRWSQFPEAYPSLELDSDRAAIMRLHAMLHAA
jgi:NADH pyrophosphatase NudC (nudix superfamily)